MMRDMKSSGQEERRHEWKFFSDNGQWLWRLIPPRGKAISSQTTFQTLTDCIADARRNGYRPWASRERRREVI